MKQLFIASIFSICLFSCSNEETTIATPEPQKPVETYNGIPISEKEPENYTGPIEVLYNNGLPKMTGNKKNGLREGRWQSWHPTGAPASECDYKNGVEHGEYMVFHESTGKIMITGQYENGKKIGSWTFYDEDGKVALDTIFK